MIKRIAFQHAITVKKKMCLSKCRIGYNKVDNQSTSSRCHILIHGQDYNLIFWLKTVALHTVRLMTERCVTWELFSLCPRETIWDDVIYGQSFRLVQNIPECTVWNWSQRWFTLTSVWTWLDQVKNKTLVHLWILFQERCDTDLGAEFQCRC